MNTYPKDPLMTSNETASSLKKHNDIFQNQKCSIHQNVPFEFTLKTHLRIQSMFLINI